MGCQNVCAKDLLTTGRGDGLLGFGGVESRVAVAAGDRELEGRGLGFLRLSCLIDMAGTDRRVLWLRESHIAAGRRLGVDVRIGRVILAGSDLAIIIAGIGSIALLARIAVDLDALELGALGTVTEVGNHGPGKRGIGAFVAELLVGRRLEAELLEARVLGTGGSRRHLGLRLGRRSDDLLHDHRGCGKRLRGRGWFRAGADNFNTRTHHRVLTRCRSMSRAGLGLNWNRREGMRLEGRPRLRLLLLLLLLLLVVLLLLSVQADMAEACVTLRGGKYFTRRIIILKIRVPCGR